MNIEKTVADVAVYVRGELIRGDPHQVVRRVMSTDAAEPDAITFVTRPDYLTSLKSTRASAVLLAPDMIGREDLELPEGVAIIRVEDAYLAFAQAAQLFSGQVPSPVGIHASAVIDPSAVLEPDVSAGPFVYIGPRARIGRGVVLHPGVHVEADAQIGPGSILYNHVVVRHQCEVGARCIVHPGVVVGSDGFGFAQDQKAPAGGASTHVKIPQTGNAVLGDDVEVGANTCIDRATFGTTRVGAGSKIDNLVQVAHNVEVGPGCLLVAQSGVAGSARLGAHVILAAQAGVCGHVQLGDGCVVGGQAGVREDVKAGADVIGSPAVSKSEFFRRVVRLSKLDELFQRVKKLERLLAEKVL